MKKYLSIALVAIMAILLLAVPAMAQNELGTKIYSGKEYSVYTGTNVDSMEVDTSGWYRTDADSVLAIFKQAAPTTTNPLCTLVVDYKWRGNENLTLSRDVKLLADSTETVHWYKLRLDSLGDPSFRFRQKSKRDSTDNWLYIQPK